MKVVTAAEMRAIEQGAVERGISLEILMDRAGRAVAARAGELCDERAILLLVGPGNNGGDGLVAARRLEREGRAVTVYAFHRPEVPDFAGRVVTAESDPNRAELASLVAQSSVVVDALLGIGQSRPPDESLASILQCANGNRVQAAHAIAVDMATGVNADTGTVPGQAFRATETLAMGYLKCGNVLYPGAEYAGHARVIDIGVPDDLAGQVRVSAHTVAEIARLLPRRGLDSNKGTYGRLLLVGGCHTFLGAPAMSALAAYRAGAGLVEIATTRFVQQSVAAHALEPVFLPLPEAGGYLASESVDAIAGALGRATALVFGPGMGLTDGTVEVTREVLSALPGTGIRGAVVDADGLNALAKLPDWWKTEAPLILTPHPGEMGRLTGLSTNRVQADRLAVARRYAFEWGKVVVLKGAGTVVASPSGDAAINLTGGPNLATAGTGDVLSGTIGGLVAQGCQPFVAAVAGVYLHGRAGDILRAEHGDAGTIASDLVSALPGARQSILQGLGEFV
jgi:NAD(P)H-hydrate epimerase